MVDVTPAAARATCKAATSGRAVAKRITTVATTGRGFTDASRNPQLDLPVELSHSDGCAGRCDDRALPRTPRFCASGRQQMGDENTFRLIGVSPHV